jgi:hypothetical protein
MIWDDFHAFFSFSPRRKKLLERLKTVIDILQNVGCSAIYIDGSFVTNKVEPNDWDACYMCSLDNRKKLEQKFPLYNRKLQKLLYSGDLFYAYDFADEKDTAYLGYFQKIKGRNPKKKGIIKINL